MYALLKQVVENKDRAAMNVWGAWCLELVELFVAANNYADYLYEQLSEIDDEEPSTLTQNMYGGELPNAADWSDWYATKCELQDEYNATMKELDVFKSIRDSIRLEAINDPKMVAFFHNRRLGWFLGEAHRD